VPDKRATGQVKSRRLPGSPVLGSCGIVGGWRATGSYFIRLGALALHFAAGSGKRSLRQLAFLPVLPAL